MIDPDVIGSLEVINHDGPLVSDRAEWRSRSNENINSTAIRENKIVNTAKYVT